MTCSTNCWSRHRTNVHRLGGFRDGQDSEERMYLSTKSKRGAKAASSAVQGRPGAHCMEMQENRLTSTKASKTWKSPTAGLSNLTAPSGPSFTSSLEAASSARGINDLAFLGALSLGGSCGGLGASPKPLPACKSVRVLVKQAALVREGLSRNAGTRPSALSISAADAALLISVIRALKILLHGWWVASCQREKRDAWFV